MSEGSNYLAKPSGQCCLKGNIHEGEPRGTYQMIGGMKTYIARPPPGRSNGNIVLYFADVWGLFNNGLLIVDGFADAGYLTLACDYFRDDPVWKHRKDRNDKANPEFDYEAWKRKHIAFADEMVPGWLSEVKSQFGSSTTRFACVGYCFGAPYVCNELAGDTCTAGAFAHPAFLKEHHFEALKKPLFLSLSQIDHTFDVPSRRKAIDILSTQKKQYQVQEFSGVEHGFALRGDMSDPYQRFVKEQSLKSIIDWFDFWLSQ